MVRQGLISLFVFSALCASANAVPDCEALARYSAERAGVSLIVLHRGETVCEDYPSGASPESGWALASGTKSFSGMIAAAAVQDGLLRLDEPVSQTLPAWRNDPQLAAVTIRQLLSLTSGTDYPGHRSPMTLPAYDRAAQIAISIAEPGSRFAYASGPFQVFGAVMAAKLEDAGLEEDPLAYLQRRVLDPLEIAPTQWRARFDGQPNLPFGAAFTARDWARFGQLVLLGGHWEGRQLVDPDALRAMMQGTDANPAYGLTWWLAEPVSDAQRDAIPQLRRASDITEFVDVLPPVWMAAGAGRQRLYVIPEADLVIVRQTDLASAALFRRAPDWSDGEFLVLALGR